MNTYKLAVLMPNYNHGHFIESALESAASQLSADEEVIVIDDASTDNSLEIIQECMKKYASIKLIKNCLNIGPAASQEIALKCAYGEFILLMAADDKILPSFFEASISLLKKNPQAGMCLTDTVTEWEGKGLVQNFRRGLGDQEGYFSPEKLISIMSKRILYPSGFGAVFKKEALLETGLLSDLKWSSDRIYSLIIALRHGVCYVPEPLAYQRRRSESYGESGLKNWKEHKEVIKRILDWLKQPKFSDVLPKIQKSCALASLGMPLLRVLIFRPKHWDYFSLNLVRLILWNEFKDRTTMAVPLFIKKFYRKSTGRDE